MTLPILASNEDQPGKLEFSDVAKKIITKAFRSAICIDDAYASAYSLEKDLEEAEPRELYYSFRKVGLCDLDIHHFKNLEESWSEHMLHNKDLIILDWELDPGNKYDSTIEILKQVVKSKKIPFIVIYTNTEDISVISRAIVSSFSPITTDQYNYFVQNFNKLKFIAEQGQEVDFETFKEVNPTLFLEYITFHNNRSEIATAIFQLLHKELPIQDKHRDKLNDRVINDVVKALNVKEEDALLFLSYLILKDDSSVNINSLRRIETKEHSYLINDYSTLIIFQKQSKGGIKPGDLFQAFSNAIINNPHNFLSLLSLEFKDNLKENFAGIGSKFSSIDEKAFFYHMSNYKDEKGFKKGDIYDFILKSWVSELYQQKINERSEVIEYLGDRYNELEIEKLQLNGELILGLIKYSSYISTTDLSFHKDKPLWFGDMFKNKDGEYFLCITPHCDCLHSKDKIKNNFYFVKGKVVEDQVSALKNAEKDFLSFIIDAGRLLCIEWKCKPFTAYVNKPTINETSISYTGKASDLIYITTLKENYTQRISNEAFSYGYRVGIDLPHLA